MENFYTAYLKTINGDKFYFVKQYRIFPEYKNVPPILEKYAMHTDFSKACKIAMIDNEVIKQQLIDKLPDNGMSLKLKETQSHKAEIYKFRPRQINFLSILRLIRLRKVS